MKMPENSSIIVCCAAKNIRKTFSSDFEKISTALSSFKSVRWIVVESNSTDGSFDFLQNFVNLHPEVHAVTLGSLKGTGLSRTRILAQARNKYLEIVFGNPQYSSADYLAIADLNGLNDKLSSKSILSSFEIEDWDFCTANQSGRYYDVWALRHHLWSPNDCWEQLSFYRSFNKRPNYTLNASVNIRMLKIPADFPPILVDSAFGGFGLLRLSPKTIGLKYEGVNEAGNPVCEHISFCKILKKQGGTIIINPRMINTRSTDHSHRLSFFKILFRNVMYPIKFLRTFSK